MIVAFSLAQKFKQKEAQGLFEDYVQRIRHFAEIKITFEKEIKKESGGALWVCHRDSKVSMPDSDQLAKKLETIRDGGIRHLLIAVGGADGFSSPDIQKLQPDFVWSFGPLTLPHELAAVVAAEQIYRAWTILNHLPYHKGHR